MAMITGSATASASTATTARKGNSFWENQRLAKQRVYEKKAKTKKIALSKLTTFTQQLSAMLEAGLPLVQALEALQDQTEDPVFRIIIRNVKVDVASGTSFSEACAKYPKAFPNLFVSMVEAGEASGGLGSLMNRVSIYFEDTVKLMREVKGAMTYPLSVMGIAIGLIVVLMVFVIPVFKDMFVSFGSDLPAPTQMLFDVSMFFKNYILYIIPLVALIAFLLGKYFGTPKGRRVKDQLVRRMPIAGSLSREVSISRFTRTYAILLRSGVPILRAIEIVSRASNNTFIEHACTKISRQISQGGQLSEVLAEEEYFPPVVKHMARAGEQTGNVDGMMNKVADFYDDEVKVKVESLTSLMEPLLTCFLGVVIGAIVMAMFLPIFNLAATAMNAS
ncbi:MAG: type IV pilus assembly protein PilC [Puniceicoccaceae bacterium 5H]|nr:MAG: type IV pilus assembly protein PilC [Puniceicoccaceae bacterium 5H]